MSRVTSFFTKRYIWVSDRLKKSYRYIVIERSLRGAVLGRCSSRLANLLKLLKITAKSFTNICDVVQFCKFSCFQPAVLSEKWNPSQVFSKEFAKILKPGSKKFSINISQNASICVLLCCQTMTIVSEMFFFLWNRQEGYAINSHVNW